MFNSVFRSLPHFTRLKSTVLRVYFRLNKMPSVIEFIVRASFASLNVKVYHRSSLISFLRVRIPRSRDYQNYE